MSFNKILILVLFVLLLSGFAVSQEANPDENALIEDLAKEPATQEPIEIPDEPFEDLVENPDLFEDNQGEFITEEDLEKEASNEDLIGGLAPVQGRDFDNDGVFDFQEIEDNTDWKDSSSNLLLLVIDGEIEVGKSVSLSIIHPNVGRVRNASFDIETKKNNFTLETNTGLAKYDIIDTGVQRITAKTGRFSITQEIIPSCVLHEVDESNPSRLIQTFLLLISSATAGLLAVVFDYRHLNAFRAFAQNILKIVSVAFAGIFFILPFFALLYFEPTTSFMQSRIFAFLVVYFEIGILIALHAYYSYKPLPEIKKQVLNPYKQVASKFTIKDVSHIFSNLISIAKNSLVQKQKKGPTTQEEVLKQKLEKLKKVEDRLLKIKGEIESSDAAPEEKQNALEHVWKTLLEVRKNIADVEGEIKNLKM